MDGPLWARPDRKRLLVRLFLESGGFCVFGHRPCPRPEHHYAIYAERPIEQWKRDDATLYQLWRQWRRGQPNPAREKAAETRAEREAEWKALQRRLHHLGERGPLRGRFNATGRDIFYSEQPSYYILGLGISGLTFRPFANIRVASSSVHLHVDLGDALKGVSKAKRRKALRYGKALPEHAQERVEDACYRAVRHYLAHR